MKFLESPKFANIISLLALIVAILTFLYVRGHDLETETFALKMTESKVINKEVSLERKDNDYLSNIPVAIYVTNTSGIVQPVSRIDYTLEGKTDFDWSKVYDSNWDQIKFPLNIEPKKSYGFYLIADIPIFDVTKNELFRLFNIKELKHGDTVGLGRLQSLNSKLEEIKLGESKTLYDFTRKEITFDFYFLSASDGITITNYPLMLP